MSIAGFRWLPNQFIQALRNSLTLVMARIEGKLVWHEHQDTGEVLITTEGTLAIEFRDGKVTLNACDIFIIPKGVTNRCVCSNAGCWPDAYEPSLSHFFE